MKPKCCFFVLSRNSHVNDHPCHNEATVFYLDEMQTKAWERSGRPRLVLIPRCKSHPPGVQGTSSNGYRELSYEEFIVMDVLYS